MIHFLLRLLTLLCFFTMTLPSIGAQTRSRPPMQWVDPDTSTPLDTRFETFNSTVVGENVSYLIWLPPGYAENPARRYPVVYWLHGLGGDMRTGVKCFLPQLISAVEAGTAPPVIAVFVNGMRDCFYHNSRDGRWPVEDMVIQDLIPHIDATWRTIPRREARAIEGYSMGGFGTAYLGFKYPEQFGAVSIMAGALFTESSINRHPDILKKMYGGDYAYWQSVHPLRIVRQHADRLRGRTRLRICVGGEDRLLQGNRDLDALLTDLHISHSFRIIPGVAHSSGKFYEAFGPECCTFYADVFHDMTH